MSNNFVRKHMENKKSSDIDCIIVTGVEQEYTPEEIATIEEELFGETWREHEKLKATGKLDDVEVPEVYEEELEP